MTVQTAPTIEYYYDTHQYKEDPISESYLQDAVVGYLIKVLEWQYRTEGWYIARNLNMYLTDDPMEPPNTPDIAVFKQVIREEELDPLTKSWTIKPPLNPPPPVVFEIASDDTMKKDTDVKPGAYARLGVAEYFWYDPRPVRRGKRKQLRGWRNENGQHEEMTPNARGWLWSEELESWLVPDGMGLRLCDRLEQQRPTAEEALQEALDEAIEEGLAALKAEEAERAAKEAERAAKEVERTAKERAWARLRELGIDPESLG